MSKCIRCREVEVGDGNFCDICATEILDAFHAVVNHTRKSKALNQLSLKTQIKVLKERIKAKSE